MNSLDAETLNIDDDLAAQLSALSREQHRSLSRVANDLLRAGLRATREPRRLVPPTFDTGRPLVDVTDVADALATLDRAG